MNFGQKKVVTWFLGGSFQKTSVDTCPLEDVASRPVQFDQFPHCTQGFATEKIVPSERLKNHFLPHFSVFSAM